MTHSRPAGPTAPSGAAGVALRPLGVDQARITGGLAAHGPDDELRTTADHCIRLTVATAVDVAACPTAPLTRPRP
ncbi:hypothetical protein E1262_26250 [Jiangella aurantiaca]|uniref:Uncharacterized protein n=1 Tax=Jiangella aurantiaca TaxID=2530373 RepID=A0A4R5A3G8_9ACTN|nr:hypothetical protein [Jiangella aurantiaca]TDD65159.1 hypothetical protein E1262_26250 [Jiangella aurantiaca]